VPASHRRAQHEAELEELERGHGEREQEDLDEGATVAPQPEQLLAIKGIAQERRRGDAIERRGPVGRFTEAARQPLARGTGADEHRRRDHAGRREPADEDAAPRRRGPGEAQSPAQQRCGGTDRRSRQQPAEREQESGRERREHHHHVGDLAQPRHDAEHSSPRSWSQPQERYDLERLAGAPRGDGKRHSGREPRRERDTQVAVGDPEQADPEHRRHQQERVGREGRQHLAQEHGPWVDRMAEQPFPHRVTAPLQVHSETFALHDEHQEPDSNQERAEGADEPGGRPRAREAPCVLALGQTRPAMEHEVLVQVARSVARPLAALTGDLVRREGGAPVVLGLPGRQPLPGNGLGQRPVDRVELAERRARDLHTPRGLEVEALRDLGAVPQQHRRDAVHGAREREPQQRHEHPGVREPPVLQQLAVLVLASDGPAAGRTKQ
jgi:hypothetical protein